MASERPHRSRKIIPEYQAFLDTLPTQSKYPPKKNSRSQTLNPVTAADTDTIHNFHNFMHDNPDSLEILLKKAKAIKNINQESLSYIVSQKGQKIISHYDYNLKTTTPSLSKKQKLESVVNNDEEHLKVIDKVKVDTFDSIFASWQYGGEMLKQETIAIDHFIDLKLETFDDLLRLNDENGRLLDAYSRVLTDVLESRVAVEILLRNLESLQVAIGGIHEKIIDVPDMKQSQNALKSFTEHISSGLKLLHSKIPGLSIKLQAQILDAADVRNETNIVCFDKQTSLICSDLVCIKKSPVWALEPYTIGEEQHLAIGSDDQSIKLCNLSQKTFPPPLTGYQNSILSLISFVNNGKQMLVSGDRRSQIELWNLSENSHVETLFGNCGKILSLASFQKYDEHFLVSGGSNKEIKIWELKAYSVVATLEGHHRGDGAMVIYDRDDEFYLAVKCDDERIGIWNLENYKLVGSVGDKNVKTHAIEVIDDGDDTKMLAIANDNGCIELWSLETYTRIRMIEANLHYIQTFQVMRYRDKLCLVYPGENCTLKVWNLDDNTLMTRFQNHSHIRRIKVFMNGGRPCLATADAKREIKLWFQED